MLFDRRRLLGLAAAILGGRGARAGDDPGEDVVARALGKARDRAKLPGMAGAIVRLGEPTRVEAVGVRKDGSPEPFTSGDLIHLGSCTKAMTATMIASLVEEGKLAWTATLADVFPDAEIDEGYRGVTLTKLLTHRAGLPANVPWAGPVAGKTATDQRREVLVRVLASKPESKPGAKYAYSNVGYVLAGLMAETVAEASWEDLMRDRLFGPLKMDSAGFGPPGTVGRVDQPWGHVGKGNALTPIQHDNPPVMGPAGTVHCTMADWAKFAELHLRGGRGEATPILKPETFATLQTPAKGEDYAMGWIATKRGWAGGAALTHTGSNTMWMATIWLAPAKGVGYLAATNRGNAAAPLDAAITTMILSKT